MSLNARCVYCNKPVDELAGNPCLWPLMFSDDETGVVKPHHVGCVQERLRELTQAKAELAEISYFVSPGAGRALSAMEIIKELNSTSTYTETLEEEIDKIKTELAAQREQVAQWMLANGFATGHGDTIADLLQELTWQVATLRAECERLRGDAERYRWLRDQAGEDGRAMVSVLKPGCNWCDDDMGVSKEPLDSAIDAAMKDQP